MKHKNTHKKAGFSLLEVMVAALILVVLVIGGAAILSQAGGDIQVIGNKQIALERARTELERLHDQDYAVLRADAVSGDPSVVTTTETHNGVSFSITTTNRLVATGGIIDVIHGSSDVDEYDNEYIELSVRATYRSADEDVLLYAIKALEL